MSALRSIRLSLLCLRLGHFFSMWNDKARIAEGFSDLIANYRDSVLVFSYRSNGIPSIEEIISMLNDCNRHNDVYYSREHQYALSNAKSKEVLIVSYP